MNVQNQDHPSIKVLITGISGSGKTTLLEKIVARELLKISRTKKRWWVFIYDHKDRDMEKRFGVAPCYTKEELNCATARGGVVIFNPSKMFPGNREEGFEWWCKWLWSVKSAIKGVKIIIADELQSLVGISSKPRPLCVILDEGRTFEMDCYFISQAVNAIHNAVRNQIREVFVMMQGDENGWTWLIDKGFSKTEILSLTNGLWLYKNLNTGTSAKGGKSFVPKNSERNLSGL